MLRDYALKAWEMERKNKQSSIKKRKRGAKKIEEEIYDLLPKDSEDYDFQRDLEDETYEAIVSLTENDETLYFTFDDKDDLTIIGACPDCSQKTVSRPLTSAADLGQMIEAFEAGASHQCSVNHQ